MGIVSSFFRILFSTVGLLIVVYIFIGVYTNTAPPHLPNNTAPSIFDMLHNWIQYGISVVAWPLAHWTPTFTFGKWTPS